MAASIGWIGAMQIPGRLLFVVVTGRLGALGVTMAVFLTQAVGLALVALAPSLPGGLFLMIVVLGAANGMSTLARASTLAEVFGAGHYASIGGAVALGATTRAPPAPSAPRSCTWCWAAIARSSGR